jgi:hypothetical protein
MSLLLLILAFIFGLPAISGAIVFAVDRWEARGRTR